MVDLIILLAWRPPDLDPMLKLEAPWIELSAVDFIMTLLLFETDIWTFLGTIDDDDPKETDL